MVPQLKARTEIQKASLVACKKSLISCSRRADKAEDQAQDLIIRTSKLPGRLNSQARQARAQIKKE